MRRGSKAHQVDQNGEIAMTDANPEAELARVQRDQFAHYIVRIVVAMGLVDGKEPYTGDQIAFLATTAIEAICKTNEQRDKAYATERKKLLDAMPTLRPLLEV
jgi:hypothetical protein